MKYFTSDTLCRRHEPGVVVVYCVSIEVVCMWWLFAQNPVFAPSYLQVLVYMLCAMLSYVCIAAQFATCNKSLDVADSLL